jgi:hypothetical protein
LLSRTGRGATQGTDATADQGAGGGVATCDGANGRSRAGSDRGSGQGTFAGPVSATRQTNTKADQNGNHRDPVCHLPVSFAKNQPEACS